MKCRYIMSQDLETTSKKISINIDLLKTNINTIHKELDGQVNFYQLYKRKLQLSRAYRTKYMNILIIVLGLSTILTINIDNIYLRILIFLIGSLILIYMIKNIVRETRNINIETKNLNSREIALEFSHETYWIKLKESDLYHNNHVYNITSNLGCITQNYEWILYPNFAIEVNNKGLSIYVGKVLAEKISYKTFVGTQEQTIKYKYRTFEYQRWRYQRKDGGPDRRYSDNKLTKYFRYHLMYLGNLVIETPSKQFHEDLKRYWNFEIFDNINTKLEQKLSRKQSIATAPIEPVNPVKYTFKDIDSIERYLTDKNVLFTNYGESIEFEFQEILYTVNQYGRIKNSNKSIKEIVEAVND